MVDLVVAVSPAPLTNLNVNYSIGDDGDLRTADADGSDYSDLGGGVVTIEANEGTAKISLRIIDDGDVEATRESFKVSLTAGDGYALASRTTALVVVKEGVCDRTPQVRDGILGLIPGVSSCADVADEDLSSITGTWDLTEKDISVIRVGDFSGLVNLDVLCLNDNQLTTLPSTVFSGLVNLVEMYLNNNRLSALPETIFSDLVSVEEVYLHNNRLTTLPATVFSGLGELKELWLHKNHLATLPATVFSGLGNLETLYLHDNRLTTLSESIFSGLVNLEQLWLHNNRLTALPADVFSDSGNLGWLPLHGNRLATLPESIFSGLGNLERLYLHDNRLTTLPATVFSGLGNLERLYLHDNRLTALSATVFSSLGDLEELWLHNNRLTALPATVFSGLGNLEWLYLHNNPGAPFIFTYPRFEQVDLPAPSMPDVAAVRWVLDYVAPTTTAATLSAEGGELSVKRAVVFRGSTASAVFRVRQVASAAMTLRASAGVLTHSFGIETAASELVLDVVGPSVSGVEIISVPAGGGTAYSAQDGETVRVAVGFDEAAEVSTSTGVPSLTLTIGETTRSAAYAAELSNTSTLVFAYVLQADDADEDGISVSSDALLLSGAAITDVRGNPLMSTSLGDHAVLNAVGHRVVAGEPGGSGKQLGELSFDAATDSLVETEEGRMVNLVVAVSPAPLTDLNVNYSIGDDGDPHTADADGSDYSDLGGGVVTIEANEGTAKISLRIIDDGDVEATRESFKVSLTAGDGYALASRTTALVVVKEGVCDRTPQVRDGILGLIPGVSSCADVADEDLSGITGTWDLTERDISVIRVGDFSGLVNLDVLCLNDNQLTTLPATVFSGLVNLVEMYLNNNRLSALPESIFSDLVSVEEVYLHNNRLTTLPATVFSGLGELKELWLHKNRLGTLPETVFSSLGNLEKLYLHDNLLTTLPATVFSGLGDLKELWLHKNHLATLPETVFSGLGNLETLPLHGNRLTALPERVFSDSGNLSWLLLHRNRLATLPETVFSSLGNLEKLYLHGNRLTTLPATVFSSLGDLKELWLYHNRLATLPESVFSGLGNLKKLVLHHNQLTALPTTIFSGLGNLGRMYLHNNRLTALPEGIFSGLGNLNRLWVHNNPGAPFIFTYPRFEQVDLPAPSVPDVAAVRLVLDHVALTTTAATLSAEGGELSVGEVVIPRGSTAGAVFRVRQVASAAMTLRASTGVLTGSFGIETAASELVLDVVGPSVSGVEIVSVPAGGGTAYSARDGETVRVAVGFDEAVEVSTSTGVPSLTLTIGETTRSAAYAAELSSVSTLVFAYVLQVDDADEDGISVSSDALLLSGAAITDVRGNPLMSTSLGDHAISNAADHKVVGDAPGGPGKQPGELSFDAAAGSLFETEEGRMVDLVVAVSPAPLTNLNVHYSIGDDGDPRTADADGSDYSDLGGGVVTIEANEGTAKISLRIIDDGDVEATRESFKVSLTAGDGYELVFPTTALVVVKEGVCDRTPQVRDGILGLIPGVSSCADVADEDLSGITGTWDLTEANISVIRVGDFSGLSNLDVLCLNDNQLTTLPATVFSGLVNLVEMYLNNNRLSALPESIFSDLVSVEEVYLHNNRLTALPESIFSGLGNLEQLWLHNNRLTALPSDVFSDSGNLSWLPLHGNRLATLPESIFSGLVNLERLYLHDNRLTTLPATVFSGLGNLERLYLHDNRLTALPATVFSSLGDLEELWLHNNRLTTLPEGIFSGFGNLEWLYLHNNPGAPFIFTYPRFEQVDLPASSMPDVAAVILVLDYVAPTTTAATLSAEGGELSVKRAVVPRGSTASAVFRVRQVASAAMTLRASAGVLTHSFGIETAASELVLDVVGPSVSGVEIVSVPAGGGTAYSARDGETVRVAVGFDEAAEVSTSTGVPSLTLTIGETTRSAAYAAELSSASTLVFAYVLQADDADEDGISVESDALLLSGAAITDVRGNPLMSTSLGDHAILNAAGHKIVGGTPGGPGKPPSEFKLSFDAADGLVFSTREGDVVDLVVTVSPAPLTDLNVNYGIGADGDPHTADADGSDYSDLGGGVVTIEANEETTKISLRIIDDGAVEETRESFKVSLAAGDGYELVFPTTALVVIKEGVCDRTTQVRDEILRLIPGVGDCADVTNEDLSGITGALLLHAKRISVLRKGDFSGLDNLEQLLLWDNRLTALPATVFSDLGSLEWLFLERNRLTTLPATVFSGLRSLKQLHLHRNQLTALPATVFSGLDNLWKLNLDRNQLTALPETVFSGLGSLWQLFLDENQLTALPEAVFSGLDNLWGLSLTGNPGTPFTLARSRLKEVGKPYPSTPEVVAVKLTLDQAVPTTVTADLSVQGGKLSAGRAVIPRGSTESAVFTVTQDTDAQMTIRASRIRLSGDFKGVEVGGDERVLDVVCPVVSGVSIVSTPRDTAYSARDGETIRVEVGFDEAVEVSPSPAGLSLTLTIGETDRSAVYDRDSSDDERLVFLYKLQADDADADGISIGQEALRLAGTKITDVNGNPLESTNLGEHAIPDDGDHKVDGSVVSEDKGSVKGVRLKIRVFLEHALD